MGDKKLKNFTTLANEIKVNRSVISSLYYDKAKQINFDVLQKLCKYFSCSVGSILELQSGKSAVKKDRKKKSK